MASQGPGRSVGAAGQTGLEPPAVSRRYQYTALAIVMMGVLMSAVDTTAVVLGLPVMMKDLNSDIISMIWVIMAYLLVMTILGTQVGKLGDMFGRVRMYNLGFAIFTLGSMLCGFSATGPQIIDFRVLQGVGGALISSNSGAIIADTFADNERGKAFGFTGFGWSAGAIMGILVGGAFVTFLSWRYIFFINIPIGILATGAGYVMLKERSPKTKSTLDLVGMLLLGGGLYFLLTFLTNITGSGWTFSYEAELVAAVLMLFGFVAWDRRFSSPLLDLSLLRQRVLTASILAAFFQFLASFAVLFLVIMYLQGPRGLSPWNASLYLIPGYVLGGLIAPFAGRFSDRYGARVVASVGLVATSLLVADVPPRTAALGVCTVASVGAASCSTSARSLTICAAHIRRSARAGSVMPVTNAATSSVSAISPCAFSSKKDNSITRNCSLDSCAIALRTLRSNCAAETSASGVRSSR